ncbi:hypothetical protein AJ88_24765 [Mesorhizobium amorphae CCBAU 01583]|nr:hypothetical protein AJ88_24765 [Mesorhizobium amorphae CCBAU 01583]
MEIMKLSEQLIEKSPETLKWLLLIAVIAHLSITVQGAIKGAAFVLTDPRVHEAGRIVKNGVRIIFAEIKRQTVSKFYDSRRPPSGIQSIVSTFWLFVVSFILIIMSIYFITFAASLGVLMALKPDIPFSAMSTGLVIVPFLGWQGLALWVDGADETRGWLRSRNGRDKP